MPPTRLSKKTTAILASEPVSAPESVATPPVAHGNKRNRVILTIAIALLLGDAVLAFMNRTEPTVKPSAQQEIDALLVEIGGLIVLPADERPLVATVNDTDLLKDQPFFTNAQKGDKVLIYNEARKAILYSPTLKRIIDVAPLGIATPAPQ